MIGRWVNTKKKSNAPWLVVGLGNPEGKYFQTYHNMGFLVADEMATRLGLDFTKKGNFLTTDFLTAKGEKCIIIKPLTYMNRSGEAVLHHVRKYKIPHERIIVLVDDLHIDRSKIKIAVGGGHNGHNGIRNISALLGSPPESQGNYAKVKLGIKPEKPPEVIANYVLMRFREDEKPLITEGIKLGADATLAIVNGETIQNIQTKYNVKQNTK